MITPNPITAAKAAGRAVSAALSGREVFVSPYRRKVRLLACANCPELNRDGQCKVCTCFVSLKSRLATETCPLKKWTS